MGDYFITKAIKARKNKTWGFGNLDLEKKIRVFFRRKGEKGRVIFI